MTCRILLAVVLLAPAVSSAQVVPPPAPVARVPATKPSPEQLLQQAYDFLRQEKYDKATPLLNRAFNETPPQERGRTLVLNRALLDLVQKSNALRGIKELTAYMARETSPDEDASNILGSLLDVAAQNPKWRDGPIYAEGFREFARREQALERQRVGYKRWGAKWITQEEYDRIKERDRELEQQIAEQGKVINRLNVEQHSLAEQYANAQKQVQAFGYHSHRRGIYDRAASSSNCAQCQAMYDAQASLTDVGAEMHAVAAQMKREVGKYEAMQKRVTKPTWPRRYPAIDPAAPPQQPAASPQQQPYLGPAAGQPAATQPDPAQAEKGMSP